MRTFTGKYSNGNFVYSGNAEVLKSQLVSILNTPFGSRFYYPGYGSRLNEYKFSPINYFTIHMISQEIKNAVNYIDGVSLSAISYSLEDGILKFNVELSKLSERIKLSLNVVNGVAS